MKKLFALFALVALVLSTTAANATDFHVVVMTHTEAIAATTTGAAIAANDEREYLLIVNDSDAIIYLGIGVAAVLNEGIRLNAAGGSYEISPRNGNFTTIDVNAITVAATKRLLVTEGE